MRLNQYSCVVTMMSDEPFLSQNLRKCGQQHLNARWFPRVYATVSDREDPGAREYAGPRNC